MDAKNPILMLISIIFVFHIVLSEGKILSFFLFFILFLCGERDIWVTLPSAQAQLSYLISVSLTGRAEAF